MSGGPRRGLWVQVRSMELRQKREMAEEEERRARQAELDAVERKKAAKARLEVEAFEQQLQACARLLCSLSVLPLALWCWATHLMGHTNKF